MGRRPPRLARFQSSAISVLGYGVLKRVQMAAETQADVLVSNCPFCLTLFEDGVKGPELEELLRPRDIAEILAERIIQKSYSTIIRE